MQRAFKGVNFEIAQGGTNPAVFILSVRKSGSTLLNQICGRLASYNACNYVNVPEAMFDHNVSVADWINDPGFVHLVMPGNAYGGFRDFPSGLAQHPAFHAALKVLLVRDPRDALVSEYFSNAYTHPIPDGQGMVSTYLLAEREKARTQAIEDYVTARAADMGRTMAQYRPSLADPATLVLRYEDVIFEKRGLIDRIAVHFRWTCTPENRTAILRAVDIVPSTEDPRHFIRKVTPGDHREKLGAGAIALLDAELHDVLKAFGYLGR